MLMKGVSVPFSSNQRRKGEGITQLKALDSGDAAPFAHQRCNHHESELRTRFSHDPLSFHSLSLPELWVLAVLNESWLMMAVLTAHAFLIV